MTPIDWSRLGARILPSPPSPVLPVDDRAEVEARLDRYSEFGVARHYIAPYSEADDEIGGRRNYLDGLGDE